MAASTLGGIFASADWRDVARRKSATAGSLDGRGRRQLKVLPVARFDGLARVLSKVEELGVWPEGLPCFPWLTLMLLPLASVP